MRRKSLVLAGLGLGLIVLVAATASRQGSASDGNCYASGSGPSTPTVCN